MAGHSILDTVQHLINALKTEETAHAERFAALTTNAPISTRVSEGIAWYPLRIVETGYGFGEYPYVVVERTQARDMPSMISGGKPATLFSNAGNRQQSEQATIHWANSNRAHVILRCNEHPEWMDEGRLGLQLLHDSSSFQHMFGILRDLQERIEHEPNGVIANIARIVYGAEGAAPFPNSAKTTPNASAPNAPHIGEHINASQRAAITMALGNADIVGIHGPPGTGKTTTVVEVIRQLRAQSGPVLVCAPSNAAVDLLTERCADVGLDVVRIGNISRVDASVISHTLQERWKDHPMAKDIKHFRIQSEEYRRLATKYKRSFGRSEMQQRKLLIEAARNVMKQARMMEEQLASRILAEADVITCTLVGARHSDLGTMRFATCIIDEAAQALDPAIWIPMMRADRTIVAGDPCQLPPTILSQHKDASLLGTTMLERLVTTHPERVALLSEQYRMNTVIMGFSNTMFYEDKVTSHASVENRTFPANRPIAESLVFVDTAGTGWNESAGEGSESLQNEGEAALVERILVDLRQHEELERMSVGVISPYRGQVRALHSLTASNVSVQTVDSFQGSECDVIIISLVRSNADGDIGFLKDTRRMNVAMTRARRKLVVVGDSATISNHPFYRSFIEYAEKHGTYTSAWSM